MPHAETPDFAARNCSIRTDLIEAAVPVGVDVIRAMPNTPARVDKGVTGISAGTLCRPESVGRARVLLESIGLVVEIPEALRPYMGGQTHLKP